MRVKLALSLLVVLGGCSSMNSCSSYVDVPPNDIAMMLTPTGYDKVVYSPGQVNIGTADTQTGQGNKLVLIQRSGVEVKEQFLGADSNADKEDHRCLIGTGAQPMSLDVRLILALPDYETPDGKRDLARLFQLGNPTPLGGNPRVLMLTAQSVYSDQAQLQVRGKIRQLCAGYQDFNAAYAAFADIGENGLSNKIKQAVALALNDNHVPLHLVDAVVSNMKPDQSVIDAIAARQAATERTAAIEVMKKYLDEDPTGRRLFLFKWSALENLVAKANSNGHNTIFLTDTNPPSVVPLKQ